MIACGKQCLCCDFPIHMDTYKGCSHGCLYCATRKKYNIDNVQPLRSAVSLRNFISGKRSADTKWCDWSIPVHWGANSDPFQPLEEEKRVSLECLRVFAETHYPFMISTKNPVLLTKEPWLSVLSQCNAVVQISMACPKYDKLEPGAPSFEERLKAAEILAPRVRRVVARIQPLFPDAASAVLKELPRYKEAGIHGVISDGFYSIVKQKGMVKENGAFIFPREVFVPIMVRLKAECAKNGLEFTCSEGGLSWMSDHETCCGVAGLEDFVPNGYHLDRIAMGCASKPTSAMTDQECIQPFKGISQSQAWALQCKGKSFAQLMQERVPGYVAWYEEIRGKFEKKC